MNLIPFSDYYFCYWSILEQDNSMNISSKQNSEMVIAKEQSTDHEDEAEKLRAALLEQVF